MRGTTVAEAALQRAGGRQPSRFKSLVAAAVVGFASAALTYRLLRGGDADADAAA